MRATCYVGRCLSSSCAHRPSLISLRPSLIAHCSFPTSTGSTGSAWVGGNGNGTSAHSPRHSFTPLTSLTTGIEEAQEPDIERYHCPECARTRGPTQFKLKRKSHRARTHIDYAALDAGQGRERHPHEDVLAQRSFARHDFPRMSGSQMTVDYVAARGLDTPVLFESSEGRLDLILSANAKHGLSF